jgi:hypothetical protein
MLPNTEVLNFGVQAYGPDQARLRYQRDGASWHPCVVLVGHMVENINRVVNRFRPYYLPDADSLAKPRYVSQGDHLDLLPIAPSGAAIDLKDPAWVERHLSVHDYWYTPNLFTSGPLDQLALLRLARTAEFRASRVRSPLPTMYQTGSEPLTVLTNVLTGFAQKVRLDGATPLVLIFPSEGEIEAARDGRPKVHAPLLAELDRRSVAYLDFTEALGRAARDVPVEALIDGHYRTAGNTVVARTLAAKLNELNMASCSQTSQ